ncbi:NUDIX domain-containing protein [Saccharothrix obliqua]|uniref:NUDIX domain-containing protein n=1 Tax=Saccharothrix obliqua TaxID=2861747 RepID=UPI001C607B83|nr:NUDIX hydrolase [Saccharothrix obliqua]MBW4717455.1 NUDIX hydrolase [Saccharothrix obliqua]
MTTVSRAATAAGALFTDPAGRVLLVEHTYQEPWGIPGGLVEPGETPAEGCAREVAEELGLAFTPGPLLVVDWAPTAEDGDKVLFVFDGGVLHEPDLAALRVDGVEIRAWHLTRPDALGEHLTPRLVRRLTAALAARHAATTRYLEHGVPRP